MMSLCDKIEYLRKKENLSQVDLADKLGISARKVSDWENGVTVPDINEIKLLTQCFHVSFDFLMDDNIECTVSSEQNQSIQKHYRTPYNSKKKMDFYQGDYDHGYTADRKVKRKDSNDIFQAKNQKMKETLTRIGADFSLILQSDIAGCFFENSTEMFFGFFYGGKIQFLCPCENFINIQVSNSGNNSSYITPPVAGIGYNFYGGHVAALSYDIIVTYFDENGKVADFSITLHCTRNYTQLENSAEMTLALIQSESDVAQSQLTKISARMNSYPAIASRIQEGTLAVNPIDFDLIMKTINEAQVDEEKFLESIVTEAEQTNNQRASFITLLFGIGFILLVAFLFWIGHNSGCRF